MCSTRINTVASEYAQHLVKRHDGHQQKAKGYYTASDDIVKYGFWVLILLVLCLWLAARIYTKCHRRTIAISGKELSEWEIDHHTSKFRLLLVIVTTISRKASYLRLASSNYWLRFLTPPSFGQCVFLSAYWLLILGGLWTNVIFDSPSKVYGIQWEVVGFRAAWVSTTQLPLLYATGCRFNIISLMTGITHERLNWFHRWIARTLFLTLIVHWSFFFREWDIAGFVKQEFEIMPMVIWGFAGWASIGLMVLSGFGFFRDRFFEVWLVSHITLAWAVLALSYKHTHCTTYFVGASIAMLIFDQLGRLALARFCNVSRSPCLGPPAFFGNQARLEILNEDYLRLTIDNTSIRWKAGQHIYVNIPKVNLFQSHPFTILGADVRNARSAQKSISLVIKRHSGFTKALHDVGSKSPDGHLRVFLQGPYGNPPFLEDKCTGIFVATGNRASFTIPLMIQMADRSTHTTDIAFHWIVPKLRMLAWYKKELQQCISVCQASSTRLAISVYTTQIQVAEQEALIKSSGTPVDASCAAGRDSMQSDSGSEIPTNEEVGTGRRRIGRKTQPFPLSPLPNEETDSSILEAQLDQIEETEPLTRGAALIYDAAPAPASWLLEPNIEKMYHCSISKSRPSADEVIMPTMMNTQGSVAVVAAVPSTLAADIGKIVCDLLDESRRDVHLWVEANG